VLCVTHLPQVAANGDQQWLVVKSASRGKVNVQASLLNRAARIEELARMLGGSESTGASMLRSFWTPARPAGRDSPA